MITTTSTWLPIVAHNFEHLKNKFFGFLFLSKQKTVQRSGFFVRRSPSGSKKKLYAQKWEFPFFLPYLHSTKHYNWLKLIVFFSLSFFRNEVNDKNQDSGPRRSLQRSATLPANPRNNPILRHHQRYHQDEPNPQIPIIVQQPTHYPQLHQKVRIRVRSTSTDKAGEINNNQNHVSEWYIQIVWVIWVTNSVCLYLVSYQHSTFDWIEACWILSVKSLQ